MAGGGSSSPVTLLPDTAAPKLLKPLSISSICTPLSPKKLTKRKNYLRPKILRTLTKPLLPQQPSLTPITPVVDTPENDVVFEPPPDEIEGVIPAVDEVKEFQVSQTEGVIGEHKGKFSANALKIGLGLVGVFLLQTIWTVWVLGKADSDEKNKKLSGVVQGINGVSKGNTLANGNVVYLDETEFRDRINEIKAMAREARRIEEKEMKNGDEVDDNGSMISKGKIGIEKEIGDRLVKLQKKLNSQKGNLSGSYRKILDEYEDDDNDGDAEEVDKMLMFKKKFKFRNPSMSLRKDVKGFSGLKDRNAGKHKNSGLANTKVDSRESISRNLDLTQNESEAVTINSQGKMPKEMGVGDPAMRFGNAEETSQGRPLHGHMKTGKSRDSEMQKMQTITKESQEPVMPSNKTAVNVDNGSSEQRVLEKRPSDSRVEGSRSDVKSEFWWLRLPYVLGIFMRRGQDHEGQGGLFTLRGNSEVLDQSVASYTVAFQDRGDANNFCYLLESYFKDLGDFSAEIVPMSVKELYDAVKSNNKKVVVVKRGQLKLYAGQPFTDVEMALLSLV